MDKALIKVTRLLDVIIETKLIIFTVKATSTTSTTTKIEITNFFPHALYYISLGFSLIQKLNINKISKKTPLACILIYQ